MSVLSNVRPVEPPPPLQSGGKVEWARLITRSGFWDRHDDGDATMVELVRTHTALNIVPAWHPANPAKLDDLCRYPFVYADNIAQLHPDESANLAEYLRRGGFLLIDCCTNIAINPDPDDFLAGQVALFKRELPSARIVELQPAHEIYSIYFKMTERPPQTRQRGWTADDARPLHGVFLGDRLVAIITLNGFQCGWTSPELFRNATQAVEMVTNIYVYAMTRATRVDNGASAEKPKR
jgi:hypothetical protein